MDNDNVDAAAGVNAADDLVLDPEQRPLNTLRAIQSLLVNGNSDEVRQGLRQRRFFVDDIDGQRLNAITADDVLDSPFFLFEGLSEVPHMEHQPEGRRMSGDASKTSREVLAEFFSYDVNFEEWTNFTADTAFSGDLPSNPVRTWGKLLLSFLNATFISKISSTGENKELSHLELHLNMALASFGFRFNMVTGGVYDFEIQEKDENGQWNKGNIVGEGKESGMLPRLCTAFGHELCWFGFATKIVETDSSQTHGMDLQYQELGNVLGFTEPLSRKTVPGEASQLVLQVLNLENPIGLKIRQVAGGVLARLGEGRQEPHDAVNLWAAVMQACLYTVEEGRIMTMVMSARVFWFIRLRTNGLQQCVIEISQGYDVGGEGFLRTLVHFFHRAKYGTAMEAAEKQMWNKALQPTVEEEDDDDDGHHQAQDQGDNETSDECGNENEETIRPPKRSKHQNTTQRPPAMYDSDSPPPFTEQTSDSTPRLKDKYGVVVPWLHQIGKPLRLLAKGRSGIVTKNMWSGQPVAVKKFVLQEDDDRSFFDVYKHECRVLRKLRSLWGEHVPRLLFSQPWRTSPMIGLQLGEQLHDDMSTWDPEDLEKANETIEKVAALGWVQRDVRGSNFVRLRNGRKYWIAMIDFESVEKIEK